MPLIGHTIKLEELNQESARASVTRLAQIGPRQSGQRGSLKAHSLMQISWYSWLHILSTKRSSPSSKIPRQIAHSSILSVLASPRDTETTAGGVAAPTCCWGRSMSLSKRARSARSRRQRDQ